METSTPLNGSRTFLAALDIFERVAVACLFGSFVYRMIFAFVELRDPIYFVLVLSEGLVVVFTLIRRSAKSVSLNPLDWILAFVATTAPLFAVPVAGATPLIPVAICAAMTFVGLALQIAAKLTLRRSFGIVAANRGITTGGPYLYVRHPMYVAYMFTWVGFLLANPSTWNFCVYAVAFVFQVARLMAEERLLIKDQRYQAFTRSVPYRLVPMVF